MNDLYAAVAAAPDDPGPVAVLADALQQAGDPIGTLIVAQQRLETDPDDLEMRRAVERLLRTHPDLVPRSASFDSSRAHGDTIHLTWRWGFVRRIWLDVPAFRTRRIPNGWARWDWPSEPEALGSALLDELLAHPASRFVRSIVVIPSFDIPEAALAAVRSRGIEVEVSAPVEEDATEPGSFPDGALDAPEHVRVLTVRTAAGLERLLPLTRRLVRLEVLHLGTPHVPDAIADLPALRVLSLQADVESLPDRIFANPCLEEVDVTGCRALQRAGWHPTHTRSLLRGFRWANTPPAQRRIEALLFTGSLERAQALARPEDLVRALESNVSRVRSNARTALDQVLPPRALSGRVAFLGRPSVKRAELLTLVREAGLGLAKSPAGADWVVVGEQPGVDALEALRTGNLALERDVLTLARPSEPAPSVVADLRSRDSDRTLAALDALVSSPPDRALLAEVLAVAHDVQMPARVRKRARGLFASTASPALQTADQHHLRQSPLTSGAARRYARLRAIEADAPDFDALTFALALGERGSPTWTLVFERADAATQRDALERALSDGTLSFAGADVSDLPDALASVPVRELELNYLGLERVPDVVARLPGLVRLDLSENALTDLPDLAALAELRRLDVWGNRFTGLPNMLRGLRALEELDVSAVHGSGVRLRHLPDWIGELAALTALSLRAHHLEALPDGLFALHRLETLDVADARLPDPDARLGALTRLRTLHVGGSSWAAHTDTLRALLPDCEVR